MAATKNELERRFLRIADVVLITGLSKAKIHSEIRAGKLKGKRFDRAILIPVEGLEEYLRRGVSCGTSPTEPGPRSTFKRADASLAPARNLL